MLVFGRYGKVVDSSIKNSFIDQVSQEMSLFWFGLGNITLKSRVYHEHHNIRVQCPIQLN